MHVCHSVFLYACVYAVVCFIIWPWLSSGTEQLSVFLQPRACLFPSVIPPLSFSFVNFLYFSVFSLSSYYQDWCCLGLFEMFVESKTNSAQVRKLSLFDYPILRSIFMYSSPNWFYNSALKYLTVTNSTVCWAVWSLLHLTSELGFCINLTYFVT